MVNRIGTTRSIVRLRKEMNGAAAVAGVLAPNTPVVIIREHGDWFWVKAPTAEGFVNKFFVILDDSPLPSEEDSRPGGDLSTTPLEPPSGTKIELSTTAPYLERLVAQGWNSYGGILTLLSERLEIDPAVAVAVFVIESGGRGFGSDGRMIIRFEIHIFHHYWGQHNHQKFNDHFRFNQGQSWMGHEFRTSKDSPWKDVHIRKQSREWEVYEFASDLNLTAARLSISMGAPQIMGFNYKALGYDSVHEMFNDFSSSIREQIIGFFNFIKGPEGDNRRVEALQNHDFVTFAKYYNGSGQAEKYGNLIRDVVDVYHHLRQ